MVALINAVYRAPCLSLCERRTFTLSLKVRRLVKRRNPWIVALIQGLRYFSKDCGAFPRIAVLFQGLWCFSKDCSTFPRKCGALEKSRHVKYIFWAPNSRNLLFSLSKDAKKSRNMLPAQIQRQTIKVWHVSYQKVAHKCLISVVFFLMHTITSYCVCSACNIP